MTSDETYPPPVVPASEIAEPQPAYLPFGEIFYPESDGQPMAETEAHIDELNDLVQALRHHFRGRDDVYVAGNLFIYYEQGNPKAAVAPDVFVVHGVPKLVTRGDALEKRRTYKLWQEGRAPSMVIEVTSEHTQSEDSGRKKDKYTRLGVEEYFLWDPFGGYLKPRRLLGFRLLSGAYRPMPPTADGSLLSRTTGVTLTIEGNHLRLLVTATGEPLLADRERAAAADERAAAADERAAGEEAARRQAEERAAGEAAARRQAEERAAGEAAARRQAEAARQQAEERAEKLRAELERFRGEPPRRDRG